MAAVSIPSHRGDGAAELHIGFSAIIL